ncbi:hypothetical protein HK096_003093, partial [Nowakowskiella sp. JEL0078]
MNHNTKTLNTSEPVSLGIKHSGLGFDTTTDTTLDNSASPFSALSIHSRSGTPIRIAKSASGTTTLEGITAKNLFASFQAKDTKENSSSEFGGFSAFSAFTAIPSVFTSGTVPQSTPPTTSKPVGSSWLDSLPTGPSLFSSFKPSNGKSSAFGKSNEGKDEDVADESELTTEFIPVVNLVEKEVLITGEENEVCEYSERARLFHLANNDWRERGTGLIKLNKSISSESSTAPISRLVMRTDGAPRLILNVRITKLPVTLIGDRFVRFCGIEPVDKKEPEENSESITNEKITISGDQVDKRGEKDETNEYLDEKNDVINKKNEDGKNKNDEDEKK